MEPIAEVLGRVVGNTDSLGRPRVQTVNDDPSKTVQSDAYLADISNILAKHHVGVQRSLDEAELVYRDVSEFKDFQDVMNETIRAKEEFMKLPPRARRIFENDVTVWLDTAHDDDKREELVAAGILKGPVVASTDPGPPPIRETAPRAVPVEGAHTGAEGE